MDSEVKALVEMFPDIPKQIVHSVWESCQGNFSSAVDEALTITSLGTFDYQDRSHLENVPRAQQRPELWQDESSFQSALSSMDNDIALPSTPPSEERGPGGTPRMTGASVPLLVGDTAWTSNNGQQKLPLKSDSGQYVVGSGELGLLAELQMPRRGGAVVLPEDFLRMPGTAASSATAGTQATAFMDERDGGESGASVEPLIDLDFDDNIGGHNDEFKSDQPGLVVPSTRSKNRVNAKLNFLGNHPLEETEDRSSREEGDCLGTGTEESSGDYADENQSLNETSHLWCGTQMAPAQDVETASAAERIAAFRPGTKFRVAVDKGVTGLGITVKDIGGRFFVYKLQTLPDGSPGAAEEAGIKAGDELLGVEELDFEKERWTMGELVLYMNELVGVVILHVMRGNGPLPLSSATLNEKWVIKGMNRGHDQASANSEHAQNGEKNEAHGMVDEKTRRLVEVLQEEGLLQAADAEDLSKLFCQIGERAKQWDSGELWLSVAATARRRPSRDAIAALADQWKWKPGEPVGWEVADSSDDGDSHRKGSETGMGREDDPAADLDKIGTALLGRPLFTADTLSIGDENDGGGDKAEAVVLTAWSGPGAQQKEWQNCGRGGGSCNGCGGRFWSPSQQLVALERDKDSRRDTVVPTKGLRKALNVRVLVEDDSSRTKSTRFSGAKKEENGLRPTPYVVWVMDVESGAEWRVRRCHADFAELREVCTGMRPSLARLDFPPWLPKVKETPGMIAARRPRLEAYLQRLYNLLYLAPLHPSSANVAHLLQDFLGVSSRLETLERLQRSRPERELRQALQVRAWQVLRLPPLERAVANFVREVLGGPSPRNSSNSSSSNKRKSSPNEILESLTEIIERLQYVITEGCFDDLREMVRVSDAAARSATVALGRSGAIGAEPTPSAKGWSRQRSESDTNPFAPDYDGQSGSDYGGGRVEVEDVGKGDPPNLEDMAKEDEALELISGSVWRQVEAEVFVPVMGRLYELLRTQGPTAQKEKAVAAGMAASKGKPQSFHGIPLKNLSPSSWYSVTRLLHAMGSFTLPCDKLDALVAVAHAIPALYRLEHPGNDTEGLGTDDLLPIFIFILVNSRIERVNGQSLILEALCDPKRKTGETGFCVATMSAALLHLARASEGDQSRKSSIYSLLGKRMLYTCFPTVMSGMSRKDSSKRMWLEEALWHSQKAISVNTVESSLIGQEGDLSQEDEGVQRRRQEATTPLGSWGFLYF